VLNLARKIGSHCLDFFQRHQRQNRKKDDASPRQETNRRSKEAGAHRHTASHRNGILASPIPPIGVLSRSRRAAVATSTAARAMPDPVSYSKNCLTHSAGRSGGAGLRDHPQRIGLCEGPALAAANARESQTEEPRSTRVCEAKEVIRYERLPRTVDRSPVSPPGLIITLAGSCENGGLVNNSMIFSSDDAKIVNQRPRWN
jgi:hypothetical protein